jgi:hypothetical protein
VSVLDVGTVNSRPAGAADQARVDADILAARAVPAETVFPTLNTLGRQLREFPLPAFAAGRNSLADEKSSATDPQLKP